MKMIIKIIACAVPAHIANAYFDNQIVCLCYACTWGVFCGWHIWPQIDAA